MAVDNAKRLRRLATRLEPRFRARYLQLIRGLKQSRSLDDIVRLLEAGQLDVMLRELERVLLGFGDEWGDAYVFSGQQAATMIGQALEVQVSFDRVNTRAVTSMQDNRLRLVREVTRTQRAAINEAMTDGVRRGINPREQARLFRDTIGLTQRQSAAVNNFRRMLEDGNAEALTRKLRDRRFDRRVRTAVSGGRPLTSDEIERMVTRYRERYLTFRAETIARTEALNSAHAGTQEMFQQAIENGTLDAQSLVQTWDTSQDERVRGWHDSMHGQQVRPGESFTSGLGNQLRYPADPAAPAEDRVQCRCAVTTRFSEVA